MLCLLYIVLYYVFLGADPGILVKGGGGVDFFPKGMGFVGSL